MADKDGGTAFPIVHPDGMGVQYFGMSLRDYFAAKAMAACISRPPENINGEYEVAKAAYIFADAMLAERAK